MENNHVCCAFSIEILLVYIKGHDERCETSTKPTHQRHVKLHFAGGSCKYFLFFKLASAFLPEEYCNDPVSFTIQ